MKKVGVIGGGAWGTCIAKVIAENNNSVSLWCFEKATVQSINTDRENIHYLPGVLLPNNLIAVENIQDAVDNKDHVIFAVPSLYILDSLRKILTVPCIQAGKTIISIITKGFILNNQKPYLIVDMFEKYLPPSYKGNLVYISGPSHAEEVCKGVLTGLVSASLNPRKAIQVRKLIANKHLKVFCAFDIVGVQVCAALKNIIAIAFGIIDVLSTKNIILGDNTISFILAGGLNEIRQLGILLGASHSETFTSIAGIGDLDVTCRSIHSRNRRFGQEIVTKDILSPYHNLNEVIKNVGSLGYFPEGVIAVWSVSPLIKKHQSKFPIIMGIYRLLNKEKKAADIIDDVLKKICKR